jgi:carbamoyltransferase
MSILGINWYSHDSSAAILDETGKIAAAAEEERFSRKKHTVDFPAEAIRYCLKEARASSRDLRHVAFSFDPFLQFRKRLFRGIRFFDHTFAFGERTPAHYLPFSLRRRLAACSPVLKDSSYHLHFVNHHKAHAASTFFSSSFERAAILTVDGSGEWATTVLARGEGNRIIPIEEIYYPHSLGLLYSALTQFLGFRPGGDEGKVMALAAYGGPSFRQQFRELIQIDSRGHFKLNPKYLDFRFGTSVEYKPCIAELLGPPRHPNGPKEERHKEIAATLQTILEEVLLGLARRLNKKTGLKDLCLAGGVALNCSANGRLLRESGFQKIFVQPASGDAGTALGSALFVSHVLQKVPRNGAMNHAYWGPDFSEYEIEHALKGEGLVYERPEFFEERVAALIAKGATMGWFQGRMEFGPRALGGRSILADPRQVEKRDYLNREIKGREAFRPFAASVLAEETEDFFEVSQKSPFMLFAVKTKAKNASLIPAVVHEDASCRIQTVSETESPRYWKLIKEFKKQTGIPLILNTSFNLKDEPVVCTPLDAAQSFKRSHLDFLAIGPFLAGRHPGPWNQT